MGTHTFDESRRVLEAIRRIVQTLRMSSRQAEKLAGISGAQLFVLSKLAEGKPLSVNDLAERTLTHQSSVSVVVQRLVDRKLVQRSRSEEDGRKQSVEITPQGRALLRTMPGAAQEQLIEALRSFPDRERRELAELLEKLVREMGIAQVVPGMFFEEAAVLKQPKRKQTPRTSKK